MPNLNTVVDWLPIDVAGDAIVKIMMNTVYKSINKAQEGIFHIVYPICMSWSDTLESMKSCGMGFDIISSAVWVDELISNQDNPAYKLLPFYEKTFRNMDSVSAKWETESICIIAPMLKNAPTFTDSLSKYLKYWEKVGFYTKV